MTEKSLHLRGMRVGVAEPRQILQLDRGPAFFTDPTIRCAPHRRDSGLWTSEIPSEVSKAARLCRQECPVRARCLAWATTNKEKAGVWGGVSMGRDSKRTAPRGKRRKPVQPPELKDEALVDKALASTRVFFGRLTSDQQATVVRGGLARGMTYTALAVRLQHPVSVLQKLAEPDEPTLDDQVRELHARGLSNGDIAKGLGTTGQTVAASLRSQGLVSNFRVGRPRKDVAA
jgi:hypothetical protein